MAKRTRKQVDAAVVQQAMAELGITVPVRGWKEEGGPAGRKGLGGRNGPQGRNGRLVLLLATGERVVWERKQQGQQEGGAPGGGQEVGDGDVG